MNALLDQAVLSALAKTSLDDKYTLEKGRIYLSGAQALVRLPLLQKARDMLAGLNTAGFISGYRGSPLGTLDIALWKAAKHLDAHDIVFHPGLNEDLAATSVWGSQQVNLYPAATRDGIFGMWYGKGPGADRSMDVLKHANSAGTSRYGGVLALVGDDHAAKSSTLAHQSEHIFQAAGLPVLYPSNVQEYLDYGLHGWAMSRYSGLWVAMKCVTDVVESSASVEIDPSRSEIVIPQDFIMPPGGLSIRWPDPPLVQEARLIDFKWYAAIAYIRANKLNRIVIDSPRARFGIMTAGKAYLDTRQALMDLGLDAKACAEIGIRLLKIGCVWPLNAQDAREFATGLDEILVVEEKRQILEYALKEELYNWRDDVRPKVYGKFDEKDNAGGEWSSPRGNWLLPAHSELSPAIIAKAIGTRLAKVRMPAEIQAGIAARMAIINAKEHELEQPATIIERKPWFCSGCPHNTSTNVPDGSRALAGIGCHYMTLWMDRKTETFSHMGGEGVAWIGQSPFTKEKHVFANLGDGTYFHSGILAIRASIAAGVNITYKILYNDAVAMTGGQPVDGTLTVPDVVAQGIAEGARKVVVVTDEPQKYEDRELPGKTAVYHRDDLDKVQRELRETEGTSILIYDQTCAAEKRRRRKRGTYPDPARRVFINDTVCEGCGDCSVKSNCLSVEPLETPLGTKRKINQSSCNKDFSCVNGFCPSFVTLEGAQIKKPPAQNHRANQASIGPVPLPVLPTLTGSYGILVTGIGGTGVVTTGGLLGMAAHLENKGVTVLDMAGLAQKGGAVLSHVQIAATPEQIHATRIAMGEANLIIGCDSIVSGLPEVLSKIQKDTTRAAINSAHTPTSDFISHPDWKFPKDSTEHNIKQTVGQDCEFLDASSLAVQLLGDAIYTNPLMLGFSWQKGWIPLSHESLIRAIELNATQVENNQAAFEWGRALAHHGPGVAASAANAAYAAMNGTAGYNKPVGAATIVISMPLTLAALIERNTQMLASYQNMAYGRHYAEALKRVQARESALNTAADLPLTRAVAINLARLMTYKDEYEVARLFTDPEFIRKLRAQFEGEPGKDYTVHFHLAPPLLAKKDDQGHLIKKQYGPWMMPAFSVLAKLKILRGTPLDLFGYTRDRRHERALVREYFDLMDDFALNLTEQNRAAALDLANLPSDIRGFGHIKENNRLAAQERRAELIARYRYAKPVESVIQRHAS